MAWSTPDKSEKWLLSRRAGDGKGTSLSGYIFFSRARAYACVSRTCAHVEAARVSGDGFGGGLRLRRKRRWMAGTAKGGGIGEPRSESGAWEEDERTRARERTED